MIAIVKIFCIVTLIIVKNMKIIVEILIGLHVKTSLYLIEVLAIIILVKNIEVLNVVKRFSIAYTHNSRQEHGDYCRQR